MPRKPVWPVVAKVLKEFVGSWVPEDELCLATDMTPRAVQGVAHAKKDDIELREVELDEGGTGREYRWGTVDLDYKPPVAATGRDGEDDPDEPPSGELDAAGRAIGGRANNVPPVKGGNKGPQDKTSIDPSRYHAMWVAFQEKPTITHIQEKVGCGYPTARRAIEEGWPEYGYEPLAERMRRMMKDFNKRSERTLAQVRGENLNVYKALKGAMMEGLKQELAAHAKAGTAPRFNLQQFQLLSREEQFNLGGPDKRIEHGGPGEFEAWSDDALEEFILTGKEPGAVDVREQQ